MQNALLEGRQFINCALQMLADVTFKYSYYLRRQKRGLPSLFGACISFRLLGSMILLNRQNTDLYKVSTQSICQESNSHNWLWIMGHLLLTLQFRMRLLYIHRKCLCHNINRHHHQADGSAVLSIYNLETGFTLNQNLVHLGIFNFYFLFALSFPATGIKGMDTSLLPSSLSKSVFCQFTIKISSFQLGY